MVETISQPPEMDHRECFRKNCYLPIVGHERDLEPTGNILNLSTSGIFIETDRFKGQSEWLRAKFLVPRTSYPIDFCGEVVHVQNGRPSSLLGMGLRFVEINGEYRKALKNFILNNDFNETLKNLQKMIQSSIENIKPFNDYRVISKLFVSAAEHGSSVQIFWRRSYTFIKTVIQEASKQHLSLRIQDQNKFSKIERYDQLYLCLIYQKVSYFFEAAVKQNDNDTLRITMPDVIYLQEKRAESRLTTEFIDRGRFKVEFPLKEKSDSFISHDVIDFNSSGLSLSVPIDLKYFSQGQVLSGVYLMEGEKIKLKDRAKVAHITPIEHDKLKVGLEFHLERQPYTFRQVEFNRNEEGKFLAVIEAAKKPLTILENVARRLMNHLPHVQVIKYHNQNGEEIIAILNATFDVSKIKQKIKAPVVIIPPAFGRRKETTNLLAFTIVENFRRLGKEIIVIRYDGIRSVGESYNDAECRYYGKEMLNFTISQSINDLLTTLRYINSDNSLVAPSETIIVSFSNASLVARRAILSDNSPPITYWISAMGISDPQDLILNATCGIDYVYNYERGDREGTFELLGHVVKKKILGDVIDNQIAYLEDAREDMGRIEISVTWIYGKYDYWTNQMRVKDIMGIKSRGKRSVIEVPTGHVVRTGTEAMQVFTLITESIWQHLHGSEITAIAPRRSTAILINDVEWSRAKRHSIEFKSYWKDYLFGKQVGGLGFDVLSLTKEYQEMMEKQVNLLDLKGGDIIGDMGGGTGNLTHFILDRIALKRVEGKDSLFPKHKIIQIDFVPEILEKSKEKHRKLLREIYVPSIKLEYLGADLNIKKGNHVLPFRENCFTKIVGSLLISYLEEPAKVVSEFYRTLKPGGSVVLSSLKRDTDMSKAFHDLVERIKEGKVMVDGFTTEAILSSVQNYINATAHLSDLEEEGVFRFYTGDELKKLLKMANFVEVQVYETGGIPPQILVGVGYK